MLMIKNCICGKDIVIEENVIIGKPPKEKVKYNKTKIGNGAIIRSGTVIYYGNQIGNNFQTGHNVLIRQNNKIGNNISVGSGSEIGFGTLIEDYARIHSGVFIPEFTILRKSCWIGPNVAITNSKYPASKHSKESLQPVEIGDKAKIGANSTVLPGVRIGKNSLIGAGSVITKDVPANSVYAGNPAKFIRSINSIKDENGESIY